MKARYQHRIYPTDQQKKLLSQLFGCVRVVWNHTLAYCQELYRQGEKKPKYTELSKRLTQLKKTEEKKWLTEVSSIPLQQSLRDLEMAYSNFTVIKDAAARYFLSFVVEIQPENLPNKEQAVGIDLGIAAFATLSTIVLEDLNTAGMVKNRKLSRAISDLGWRSFRDMLSAKSAKYGRDFRIISRWEPTSQRCSCCGNVGGKHLYYR